MKTAKTDRGGLTFRTKKTEEILCEKEKKAELMAPVAQLKQKGPSMSNITNRAETTVRNPKN